MKDPEFVALKNRFIFAVVIAVLFCIPLTIFVVRTYSSSDILTKINKGETFTMLIVNNKCRMCKSVEKVLKNNNVNYVKLNKDKNKDYKTILKKMSIDNSEESFPVLVYVKNGKMFANLFYITDEEFAKEFITNHKLINSKE